MIELQVQLSTTHFTRTNRTEWATFLKPTGVEFKDRKKGLIRLLATMKTTCPSDQDEVTHQDSEAKEMQSGWPSHVRVQIQRIRLDVWLRKMSKTN